MGYYSGSGEVTGGSDSISLLQTFWLNGANHRCYQRQVSTVTTRRGVSLDTAQNETPTMDSRDKTYTENLSWWRITDCIGTEKSVSFSQINGSNLYELTVTNIAKTVKFDDGGWVSS